MTKKEIVAKLHEYYSARDKHHAIRLELVKMACECGQSQKDAIKGPAEYLDGYLAGCGVMPIARVA